MSFLVRTTYISFVIQAMAYVASSIDLTMVSGSTGTAVVERCIDLIRDSEIFQDDQLMVRRIAYVESLDGTTLNPVTGSGGIWKISTTLFGHFSTGTFNVNSFYSDIETHFNINWTTVAYADLDKPLYSALAARLALANLEGSVSSFTFPPTIPEQYNIWNFFFHELTASLTLVEFTDLVNQLPSVFLCSSVYRDIVFVVDSSNSITDADFELLKTFILSISDHFDLSESRTRIGITQFSLENQTPLQLSNGTSLSAVTSAVSGMTKFSTSAVHTGFAVAQAAVLFDPAFGGRSAALGVARVLVVISQQSSADDVTGPVLSAVESQIGVIAVGVTSGISNEELENLASGPSGTHVFQVADYASLAAFSDSLQDSICEEQISVTGDLAISGTLEPGESQTFTLTVPSEGLNVTLSTTLGLVSGYYSPTVRNPSSAANTFRMNVDFVNIPVFYTYVPVGNTTFIFVTIQCTSPTVAHFLFLVGNPVLPTEPSVVLVRNESGLSGGEIAGIFFACLIFLCGLVLALAYYWFGKRGATGDIILIKENVFRMEPTSRNEPIIENLASIPISEDPEPVEIVEEPPPLVVPPEPLPPTPPKSPSSDSSTMSPEEVLRMQLRLAIELQDVAAASAAVNSFYSMGLVDVDGDLIRGERLIGLSECKQGLSYALAKRDVKSLERAIFETKQKNYQGPLKADLRKAEVLLQDLKKMENLMERLNHAIGRENLDLVESLTFEIRAISGFDQATVDRMLAVHRCRQDLNTSMLNRDLELATSTLTAVDKNGFEPDLKEEVKQTKKMKRELEYLEKVRQDVLSLSQSRVSEIRSYANPPKGVQEVMTAVYLVLGYPALDLKDWTGIQALMGKSGRENLKRQIHGIDPRKVDIGSVQMAKTIVAPFTVSSVSELSVGLGVFFVLVLSVIEEVEKINAGLLDAPSPFFFNLNRQSRQNN